MTAPTTREWQATYDHVLAALHRDPHLSELYRRNTRRPGSERARAMRRLFHWAALMSANMAHNLKLLDGAPPLCVVCDDAPPATGIGLCAACFDDYERHTAHDTAHDDSSIWTLFRWAAEAERARWFERQRGRLTPARARPGTRPRRPG